MPAVPNEKRNWLKQLNSTVFPDILPGVTFFTLVAVAISVGCERTGYKMEVNTVMLSVLGTMISFVISLRTSSANDRYNEGRRAWSQISLASRTFALNVWLHVPPTSLTAAEIAKLTPQELEIEKAKSLLEKRTMINLVHAFAVSAKHYLRDEGGPYHEDLYHLIQGLPKYDFPSSVEDTSGRRSVLGLWRTPGSNGQTYLPATRRRDANGTNTTAASSETANSISEHGSRDVDLEKGQPHRETIFLAPSYNPPPKTIYQVMPIFMIFRPIVNLFTRQKSTSAYQKKKALETRIPESNLPLQITLFLSGYVTNVIQRGTMAVSLISIVLAPISQLQDSITTLERVLTTPLPFAYQAHLRFSIYAYLIFLPFQTYALLHYLSIVATALCATIFLGFFELGAQLENPFGYDDSDLPLDHYCELIGMELREIVGHRAPDPLSYVFSEDNQPFGPYDNRSAQEILEEAARGKPPGHVERSLRTMFTDHFHHTGEEDEKTKRKKYKKHHSTRSIEVLSSPELASK